MKAIVALACSLLLACIYYFAASGPSNSHVEPLLRNSDLGPSLMSEIESGRVIRGSWTLVNHSTQDRELTYAGASCGCIGATIDAQPCNSGQTIRMGAGQHRALSIDIGTGNLIGERSYHLSFREGTGAEPLIHRASVRFKIFPDLAIHPDVVSHRFTGAEEAATQTFRVQYYGRRGGPAPDEPQLIDCPEGITATATRLVTAEAIAEGDVCAWVWEIGVRIDRRLAETAGSGTRMARVRLPFQSAPPRTHPVPILVRTQRGIIAPHELSFTDKRREALTKKMLIQSDDDQPFQILSAVVTPSPYSLEKLPAGRARSHSLAIRYDPAGGTEHRGQCTIVTDHPLKPTLVVQLTGTASP
jgi:hypothetical protein